MMRIGDYMGAEMDDYAIIWFKETGRKDNTPMGLHKGMAVFPHNLYKGKVRFNSVFLCKLETENGKKTYIATPTKEVDANFIMELTESNRTALIDSIYGKHATEFRKELLARGEEALRKEMCDDLLAENKALKTTRDNLRAEIKKLKENPTTAAMAVTLSDGEAQAPKQDDGIRIRGDTLTSEQFVHERYFIHTSPNKRIILITDDSHGNIHCAGKSLTILGISKLISSDKDGEVKWKDCKEYGGLAIIAD